MEEQLKKLVELQSLSLTITRLESEIQQIPGKIEKAWEQKNASEEKAARLVDQLQEAQKECRRLSGELDGSQQRVAAYKSKLYNSKEIRNNEQHAAMLKQIEQAEEESYRLLEEQYNSEEQEQKLKNEKSDFDKTHDAVCRQCEAEQKNLTEEQDGLEKEKQKFEERLEILTGSIDPKLLSVFQRVAELRGGVGLAHVMGDSCLVCNVRLRLQVLCEVKLNNQLIQCDNCKRILYWRGARVAGNTEKETG